MSATRGYSLMADVVIALAKEPRTAKALWPAFDGRIGMSPLRKMLRRLLDGRVLRVAGWYGLRNVERIYGVGSEPSVPAPCRPRLNGTATRPLRVPTKPAAPMFYADRFCAIWETLETPCTIAEICDDSGSFPNVIRPLLQQLRRSRPKLVRIVGYESGQHRAALYVRGSKPDAIRPPRLSRRESYVRSRDRRAAFELHRVFTFAIPIQQDLKEAA